MKFGAGQPVRRLEDDRLVTGKGEYADDTTLPGTAHAVMLRSPHAHAKILSIDTAEAAGAPGVLAVYTHKDIDAAGLKPLPCVAVMPHKDGSPMVVPPRHALAKDRVCHLGVPVAMVVAETAAQARDAAELIRVEYEELPAVVDTVSALAAAPIHPEMKSNVALDHELGNKAATDAAFAAAAHVTTLKLVNQRVVVNAMEPRACLGAHDKVADKYTLYTGSQGVHGMRAALAKLVFGIEDKKLRVVTKDVGGGFGMKSFLYHEYPLVLFAAKKLGRPVKWTSERSEAFLSDTQGRDHVTQASIALDKDHRITAVRTLTTANLGGYLSHFAPFVPTLAAPGMQVGVYAIPAFYTATKCVFTNTVPVDAYRGAGRPEAAYVIERLVDKAAFELKLDVTELRRKNFISPAQQPYTFPAGGVLDSGEFARNMDDAMQLADWQGFKSRAAQAKTRGRIAGIGMAYYVEKTAGGFEMAHIEVRAAGEVHVIAGTQSNGQGHETAYAQLVAERLGVPIEIVKVTSGDSDAIRAGGGTGGSRSITMAGGAIGVAVKDIVEKGKAIASNELEAAAADIEYADGKFRIGGTDRELGLFEVARIAKTQANVEGAEGLAADGEFKNANNTWPNGCHICEVEIDPETGVNEITRYTIVDDFGKIVNPLLVAGQVHGGVVQGLGQAMGEEAVYDSASGQLVTGSFMDYWMPRADNMPMMMFKTNEVPCKTNPLGTKGCGEAGTVGAAPAFVNAIVNALARYGVQHVDMPVTPAKVWAITNGRTAA
jgi:aerobic carbon-monoxide dehydrogenase large subunit